MHGKAVPGHPNLQYWGKQGFIRVHVKVPAELRSQLGQEFNRALKTQCVAEAVRRMHGPMAEYQGKLDAIKGQQLIPYRLAARPVTRGDVLNVISMEMGISRDEIMRRLNNSHGEREIEIPRQIAERHAAGIPLAGITYQQVIEDWKLKAKPRQHSADVVSAHVAYFFARLGHGDLSRVIRKDIIAHQESLLRDGKDGKKLSAATINNHMASIRIIVKFAVENEKISSDPGGVKKVKVAKKSPRANGFTEEQFASIMTAARQSDDPAIRFIWPLMFLSGGRINEFADATVDAIYQKAGYWVFDISPAHRRVWHGKPLDVKTDSSERIVPIHSAIIEAGFLDYVETIRRERGDKAPLFPQFSPNKYGFFAKAASDRCLKWLRGTVGIDGRWLDCHATRHTFKTMARSAGVTEEISDAITGHVNGGEGRNYGDREIPILADAIERVGLAVIERIKMAA